MNLSTLQRFNPLLSPKARRYGWVVVAATFLGALLGFLRVRQTPDEYFSNGRMIVSGRLVVPDAQAVYSEELANFLGTQIEIMRSEQVLSRARQRLQLERPGLDGNARVDVNVLQRTSIFVLRAVGSNPEFVRAYLDAVMREFIEFKRERRLAVSQSTIEQIASEISRLEREIGTNEQALLVFRQKHNIGYWEQQSASSARYLSELKDREAKLRLQLSLIDNWNKATAAEGIAPGRAAPGLENATPQNDFTATRQKILTLQIEYDQRATGLRPAHPKMKAMQAEIDRQQRLLQIMEQQQQQGERERRAAINAELASIATAEVEWEAKVAESSRIEAEYQKLRSTIDRSRELYNRMVASLQTLDLSKGVDQELVQVLQPASAPAPADKPFRQELSAGGLVGALLGLAIFSLISRLDNRTYSPVEAAEILGTRQFGEIPSRRQGVLQRRDHITEAGFEEAVRRLRSLILVTPSLREKPVVLVTSALASEGKTELSLQIATAIANSGKRVLLLDADLRRGRMHAAFGRESSPPGMHEYLHGELSAADAIHPTPHAGLFFVARGNDTAHAGDLLSRASLSERVKELGQGFDMIVIDSAPVGPVDDTNWLLPLAGLVLFVVRIGRTPLRAAAEGLGYIRSRGVAEVGLVFNGVELDRSSKYYKYYQSRR